ncbi:DUF7849 domain-containing protein [Mucilaginibacter pedocola]|uniref:PKD domain-containing protein n=1 Tax=Mucilaginibacter pedocola TaxID=1792845 RepID=A0A1S9PFS9_9SPHI|nr:PKD domain-containing protein [Mucilaginibacter pedocola]OOQ59814.1 hypothetical protein BC343_06620 [Mucilaginibacter pedocola]
MKKLLFIAFACIAGKLHAQGQLGTMPADTVPAIINHTIENGTAKFSPQLRPLRPIAGAPAPYFTYFWEFGDGGFSFEKEPEHTYLDTGKFDVRLYATNNYDDGKRPPTRPKKLINKTPKKMMASAPVPSNMFQQGSSITLKNNCMPKPGDDMMILLGYRNKGENLRPNVAGTIAILYNDKEFTSNNFELAEARNYHGETATELKAIPSLAAASLRKQQVTKYYASAEPGITMGEIEELLEKEKLVVADQLKNFKSSKAWHFDKLAAGQENFVFLNFKTTPEMIKDTNATVRLTGVFLPDDPTLEKEAFGIELQIVASHDPNKMSIRQTRMSYRLTGKNRELTYKVRFQNTGKGPAKKVNVGVSISPVFDVNTIRVSKTKPEVKSCDSAYANQSCLSKIVGTDSVNFIFNNIYLPGTQQEGVDDADSTMGFVEYKIKFKEKPKKQPIYTRAAIIFDKNEPIYTNRATGRFRMGISPGIIVGYGFPIQSKSNNYLTQSNFTIGATISPYSTFGKYLQTELYFSSFRETAETRSITGIRKDTSVDAGKYLITSRTQTRSTKVTTINVVPVSLRWNFNTYFGAGVGALLALDINNTAKNNITYGLTGTNGTPDITVNALSEKISNSFSDIRTTFFADVVVGRVRVGPSLGLRYYYDPKTSASQMTTYVAWKL